MLEAINSVFTLFCLRGAGNIEPHFLFELLPANSLGPSITTLGLSSLSVDGSIFEANKPGNGTEMGGSLGEINHKSCFTCVLNLFFVCVSGEDMSTDIYGVQHHAGYFKLSLHICCAPTMFQAQWQALGKQ